MPRYSVKVSSSSVPGRLAIEPVGQRRLVSGGAGLPEGGAMAESTDLTAQVLLAPDRPDPVEHPAGEITMGIRSWLAVRAAALAGNQSESMADWIFGTGLPQCPFHTSSVTWR